MQVVRSLKKWREVSSPAQTYVEKLGELQEAEENQLPVLAAHIVEQIKGIVPIGEYEGYVDDIGERIARIRVLEVVRRPDVSNLYAFLVRFEEIWNGLPAEEPQEIDMIDFLRPVNRSDPHGRNLVAERFWPLCEID